MIKTLVRLFPALLMSLPALAGEMWSATDIQLMHGHGYKFGSESRSIMTLEHAQGKDGDDVYAFIDLIDRADVNNEAYGEIYGQKSLWQPEHGLISNVSLSLGFNAGSEPENDPFVAYLAGMSLDFRLPGFSFFQLDIHAYKDDSVQTYGWQFTPVWELPFRVGALDFRFRGFADVLSPRTNASQHWSVLAQPQLLLDVGSLAGYKKHLYAGVEYQYWHNKFGVSGVDEHLPNFMLMYAF